MPKGSHSSEEGYRAEYNSGLLADCDNEERLGFVRKVYGILAAQLTLTFGFVAFVKFNEDFGEALLDYPGIYIACLVLAFVIQCCLLCCMKVARKSPSNYILLTVFTLCWTYLVGFICATYDASIVLTAALMTAVLTVALSSYAMFTKNDFTKICGPFVCWGLILVFTISMLMSVLSMLVFTYTDTWIPFAAGFGVIIYGLFLLIDT